MKNLAMIACIGQDGGLGKGNDLLWRFSEDQQFFRDTTMGASIVMGGKTFASIGRALPGRENIVLTRGEVDADDIKVFHERNALDQYLAQVSGSKFIIGGASIYQMYLPEAAVIYLTEVDAVKPADVFFPEFDRSQYDAEVLRSGVLRGQATQGDVSYRMVRYVRKDSNAD